ncbi:glycine--tRNA ligase subunit beta [Paenibacillus glucanolyticus]|jgi:glycyl-tRNA synthetase beta chain|uniref:glycine--tRNA ligase subunit beta n=1 Tax=Paenibacillus TaxID=44249 RepID=UPI0003E1BAB7|nr:MULTISPECIES: glycine--tRNA ligase subunit beta [Paenibacillus]ANA81638.1 glycine--tRNA ligase subunit beta [Paenibacillus glucanolyticus]AVV59630.1 glycine--tRNA ligase subunit beta [Paenibacillus glucanolyticus]ETT30325.1 glycyl-tRNA ligase subunit beta [Paenibacillus sp. FSL R5-808]
MSKDLLFEIGLEEVPARFLRAAMEQLQDRMVKWLDASRIGHGDVTAYATPRRLAVWVQDVADKQEDVSEEVKGPSRKIALDESGQWSKAALGFARSQGIAPESFTFKELGGVEYIYVTKNSVGVDTKSILSEGLHGILTSMTFPKNMRWGAHEFKFVRPIKWMVAMLGSETVDLEITGVKSGNVTRGHRFLGSEAVIPEASAYREVLREQHVIVDVNERQGMIVSQIQALAQEKDWNIAIKDDLLEEVLFLVETPTVLYGTFDSSFLHIPQDVLITSMREHQRYFPVLDKQGQLLPFFVTVRSGDSRSLDVIARGNEKVLRARLSDAKFFYEEDQKLQIKDALSKLESIVFHEELGTIGDKVRRIRRISDQLSTKLSISADAADSVSRAADICKFDLVTQMVYEFPELQGVMGEDYARKAGEKEEVAKAVFEHYQPRFAGDSVPSTQVGSIVSIADKIDTIVGCFSIGIIPTGSQDPYALRRQAAGIVQIILEHKLPITLSDVFGIALEIHENIRALKRSTDEIAKDLQEFFGLRVKKLLSEDQRYDVVDAVITAGFDHVVSVVSRGHALMNAVEGVQDFKTTVESFNRVSNLAAKAGKAAVNPELFNEAEEGTLYEAWNAVREDYKAALEAADGERSLSLLSGLKEPITGFFDSVMVMAEDEAVRANRLALLSGIDGDLKQYADFTKLVW